MNTILDDFRLLETTPSPKQHAYCHLDDNKACLDEATRQTVVLWEEQSKAHQGWLVQALILFIGMGFLALVIRVGGALLGPIVAHHQHTGSSAFWWAILAYLFILVVIGVGIFYAWFYYWPDFTEYAVGKEGIWIAHKKQVQFYDFKQLHSFELLPLAGRLSTIQGFYKTHPASEPVLWFELVAINDGTHRLQRLEAWRQAALS